MREETNRDAVLERKVLIGMIVDKRVLGPVAARWEKGGLFPSRWSNVIGGWCVEYFARQQEAPGANVEVYFLDWSRGARDESSVKIMEGFLASLSGEYQKLAEDLSPDFLVDQAGRLFTRARIRHKLDRVQTLLDLGDDGGAVAALASFQPVEMGQGASIDLMDREAVRETFRDEDRDVLVKFTGDLGRFFGRTLRRGGFVGFFGPAGRGKTFWLIEVAWQAMLNRKRVLLFEVGDMEKKDVRLRLHCRAARHPYLSTNRDGSWPCAVRVPEEITRPPKGAASPCARVRFREEVFREELDDALSWEGLQGAKHRWLRSEASYYKVFTCGARELSVFGVDAEVQRLQNAGWVPDVVVLDYPDLLAPPPGIQETREKINETWVRLRGLSVKHQVLLVTATQSDSPSYTRSLLGMDNFSDDRRKNDHVTAMIGLNQTEEEKEHGVMRLNYVKLREGESSVSRVVHVAGCLPLANPAVCSTF